MKKDINIYDYHTTCPNCKGFNTRLSKFLDFRALCYSCCLFFKPSESEIKKMSTPLPVKMAIHPTMQNLSEIEKKYIKNVYDINLSAKSLELAPLKTEIRKASIKIIEQKNPKNCLILSDLTEEIETSSKIHLVNDTDIKLIEEKIYKNILKFGKIDFLIIENLTNIVLSDLLFSIKPSVTDDIKYIIYIPIFEKIYSEYNNYIKDAKYIYNTYTICREFGNMNYNIFEHNIIDNFNQYFITYGTNSNQDFNERIKNISKKEMKNIIYSEPLFVISDE